MPTTLPITATDYYDMSPPLANRAGDIWSELPTFGLLRARFATGLVITPACDLENRKSETVTYLPIISINRAFALPLFYSEIVEATNGQLTVASLEALEVEDRFSLPAMEALNARTTELKEVDANPRSGQKEKAATERASAGLTLMKSAANEGYEPPGDLLARCLGSKQCRNLMRRLVENSQRPDTHFLPQDDQPASWSGVAHPSLVLFRYPITVPTAVLDVAQDISRPDWKMEMRRLTSSYSGAKEFEERRPMKRLTMRPRFLADLITRYVSMHGRLGSPDFSDDAVDQLVTRVLGIAP